jgi:hypothetical protein
MRYACAAVLNTPSDVAANRFHSQGVGRGPHAYTYITQSRQSHRKSYQTTFCDVRLNILSRRAPILYFSRRHNYVYYGYTIILSVIQYAILSGGHQRVQSGAGFSHASLVQANMQHRFRAEEIVVVVLFTATDIHLIDNANKYSYVCIIYLQLRYNVYKRCTKPSHHTALSAHYQLMSFSCSRWKWLRILSIGFTS